MNQNTLTVTASLSGFYELDARGTVLYSRVKGEDQPDAMAESLIGKDFFAEVFDCRNSNAFRRRFLAFVGGKFTTDSFIFGCEKSEKIISMRVLLARISEVNNQERGALFYIDIKPAQTSSASKE